MEGLGLEIGLGLGLELGNCLELGNGLELGNSLVGMESAKARAWNQLELGLGIS